MASVSEKMSSDSALQPQQEQQLQQQLQEQEQEQDIQHLTDEQLKQLVDDTRRANEVLAAETQMFEKYLARIDPRGTLRSLQAGASTAADSGLQPIASTASIGAFQSSGDISRQGSNSSRISRRSGRSRTRSRASGTEKLLRLSAEQKCDIAQREVEECQLDARRANDESERVIENLYAIAEEAELRLAELKKEQYDFERELRPPGRMRRAPPAVEKVIKFMEDHLKERDSLIVKLRLKNTALKILKRKLRAQLKQKEELGEVLHEIDFSQLKIENQQYVERIDARNRDLLQLKLQSGNTLAVLNAHKKRLNALMLESERLKEETSARRNLLLKLDREMEVVDKERVLAEVGNKHLREQLEDYRFPAVMDYVHENARLYELKKKVVNWKRKNNIAEMILENSRRAWRQLQTSANAAQAPHPPQGPRGSQGGRMLPRRSSLQV